MGGDPRWGSQPGEGQKASASSVLREGVRGDLASEGSKGVSQRSEKEQMGLGTSCACVSVRIVGGREKR